MENERDREAEELEQLKVELRHVESQLESQLDRLTDEKAQGIDNEHVSLLASKLHDKDNQIAALTD